VDPDPHQIGSKDQDQDPNQSRIGKNPGLKKNPAQLGFFGFLGFFIYLPRKESFLGLFQFQ
jgi:hypothetical protein